MLALLRGRPVAAWEQDALAKVCAETPLGLKELLMHTLLGEMGVKIFCKILT
jgi:hypothetical protein